MIYIGLFLAAIAATICIYLLFLESRVSRVKPTPMLNFEFPVGLTSANVGSLIDGKVDRRDVISLIPWFAAQGYIKMERIDDVEMVLRKDGVRTNFVLHKLRDIPNNALEHEKVFFKALFPNDEDKRELKYSYDATFSEGYQRTMQLLHHHTGNVPPEKNILVLFITALVALTGSLACMTSYINFSITIFLFLLFPLVADVFYMMILSDTAIGRSANIKMICMIIGGYAIFAMALFSHEEYFEPMYFTVGISLIGLHMLVALFYPRLYHPDERIQMQMSQLLGLKEYIEVAEAQELRRIVTDNPHLFYKILAFGMAMGLAPAWVKKFRAINIMIGDN